MCLLLTTALLSACAGKEERIQSHLQKGQTFFAQAEPEKALVEVRNVLQMDPKRAAAYYLAGQIEESRGEFRGAYADYAKAIEDNPNDADAKAGLARLNLTVGNDAQAQSQVDEVLAKAPDNVQAIAVAAALRARKGDLDGAIRMASATTANGQLPTGTATVLTGLYVAKGNYAKAQAIVDEALLKSPKDTSLLAIGADIATRMNQNDRAADYYQRATLAAPKNFKLWQAYAIFEEQQKNSAKAESILRDAIQAAPDDSSRKLALVNFIAATKGEEAGEAELKKMARDRPKDYPVQFALASDYSRKGRIADARELLDKVVHADGKGNAGLSARNQLAALDLASGNVAGARTRAEEILAIDPRDSSALVLRGRIELADNQVDSAIADFRGAARDKPDSPVILKLLAQAYQVKKEPDLARDTISDAAKLFPNRPELAVLWMEELDHDGRDADAIAAANEAIARNPQNLEIVRLKAILEEKNKDFAATEATLKTAATAHPRDAGIELLLGQFYSRQKKVDQALSAYDQAATLAPSSLEPRAYALRLLIGEKRFAEAQKRLDAQIAREPSKAINYQFEGDLYSAQGNAPAAEAAFRKAIALEPHVAGGYLDLANFLATQKRYDDVKLALEDGLKANPKSTALETAEADFLTKRGDTDGAIAIYNAMLKDDASDVAAANNLAYLLTEAKGDKASLEHALLLSKGFEFSTDASVLDTLAWTHYKLGEYKDAVDILQRAALVAPNSLVVETHYGMALYKNGDTAHGREELQAVANRGAKLPEDAQRMIAQG